MAFNITSSPTNAEILASLLGDTTGLSNIQITSNGNPLAVGLFQDSPVNLSSGVVLSTGQADRLVGANTSDRNNISTVFNGLGTVPDGNDAITFEITFDADAIDHQLFLQYVFGSEEFLDFAGNSFNDRLTFELNGVNLATLNNGSSVDVNSLAPGINPNTFSPDYIDNLGDTSSASQTTLDGYTVPLTFRGNLVSNASNRLVITIQDIGDGAVDSAVFLAAGSLGVSDPRIPIVNVTNGFTPINPITLVRTNSTDSINEDGIDGISYTFTRTGATNQALSVNYQLGGTATFGTDYSSDFPAQSGAITFAVGSASTTLFVSPITDTLVEGDETVILNLLPANNAEYVIGSAGSAGGNILDEDTPLNNISLTVLPTSTIEDSGISGNLIYTFTRTGPTNELLRVDFNVGGTALFLDDYDVTNASFFQGSVGSITFDAGSDTARLAIDPRADDITESPETVELTLTPSRFENQLGGRSRSYIIDTPNAVTGNIIDAPNAVTGVSLFVDPNTVNESGQTNLSYIFTRTGSITLPLTIRYFVRGTANLGEDYTVIGADSFDDTIGTVTFQAGSNTAVVEIAPTPDSVLESEETVILQLDSIDGGIRGYNINTFVESVGTIVDSATPSLPIINIVVEPQSITENGQTSLLYVFSRSGSPTDELIVNYNIGGTAAFGADYSQNGATSFTDTTGSITFAANSNTATLFIAAATDAVVETDETVSLTLIGNSNYAIGSNSSSTGTIVDVPVIEPPTVSIALNRASVNEDGTANLSYTFTRTGPTGEALNVRYRITGTAIEATDYNTLGTSPPNDGDFRIFNFAAGASTFTVRVDPTLDNLVEGDETVSLTLLPAGNAEYTVANTSPVIGTIIDAALTLPVIDVTLSPASVNEGGQTNLTYLFTRTGSITQPLTINYSIGGTAAFTADYNQLGASNFTDTTGSVTFAANSATATLEIVPATDTITESDEIVTLNLVGASSYTIGSNSSASGTIVDIPPVVVITPPTINLAVNPASVNEDGTANLIYTFSRTGSTGESLTVSYRVDGTASSSNDYTIGATLVAATATVTFSVGANTATVLVDPRPDTLLEADETVILAIIPAASGQYIVGTSAVTGTILDQDTALNNISLAVSPNQVTEDGTDNLVYTFTRTGSTTEALRVDYDFGGSATFSSDYVVTDANSLDRISSSGVVTLNIGTVNFAAGSDTATVTVDPTSDSIAETNENVTLRLVASRNDSITGGGRRYDISTPGAIIGTITEPTIGLPRISVALESTSTNEDGIRNLTYTFTRTGSNDQPLNVRYQISGVAIEDNDYSTIGVSVPNGSFRTIDFAAGSSTASIQINPTPDTLVEGDETVSVALLAAGNGEYVVDSTEAVVGTILDQDTALNNISLTLAPNQVSENGLGNLVYTVTRTGPTNELLRVDYEFGGTAVPGIDYISSGTTRTVTFNVGSSTETIIIDPTPDVIEEPDETVALTLVQSRDDIQSGGRSRLYVIDTPNSIVGIITEPVIEIPRISVALEPTSVNEDGTTNLVYTFTRTGLTTEVLQVDYSVGGTASLGSDYSASGTNNFQSTIGSVNFAVGANTATVTIDPTSDFVIEPNETIELTLLSGGGYGSSSYIINTPETIIGTIIEPTVIPIPNINIILESTSVREGEARTLTYLFTRTEPVTQPLTVNYSVGGSATFSADYNQTGATNFDSTTGSITFAANSAEATLVINSTADSLLEQNEIVTLNLLDNSTYTIGNNRSASGTIIDVPVIVVNPPTINLTVNPARASEDAMTNLAYTFTRTGSVQDPLTVTYRVGGTANRLSGAANATSDYVLNTSVAGSIHTVTFSAGSDTATVFAAPTSDRIIEGDETVELTIVPDGSSQYIIGTTAAVIGTIVDQDDNSVSLAVSPTQVAEDGTESLIYTFTRTGSTTEVLEVDYEFGGNATFGTDYISAGANSSGTVTLNIGTVNFAAGSNTATVTVDPTSDSIAETNENISLRLIPSRNDTIFGGRTYNIATPDAISGTITEPVIEVPRISVSLEPTRVNEDGTTNLVYTFTRTGSTTEVLQVDYSVGGTASLGSDYSASGTSNFQSTIGSISFAVGETTATIVIDPTPDAITESNETVELTLIGAGYGSPSYIVDTPGTIIGTIVESATVVNLPPTQIIFNGGINNNTFSIAENTNTANRIRIVDIAITDDQLGTNNLSLGGVDAGSFELSGTTLFLRSGVALDFETRTNYNLVVSVDDVTVGNTPDVINNFTLIVTDINEPPTGAPIIPIGNATQNTPIQIPRSTFLTGFIDVENDPLNIVNLVVSNGTIVNNNDGTFTLTPTIDFSGQINITYGVTDGVNVLAGQLRSVVISPPENGLNFIGTTNLDVGVVNNLTNGIFAVNPNNINLVGDEINLLGGVNSVTVPGKTITLQPDRPSQAIQIGSNDSNNINILDLTPTDLAAIADGFSKIIIGRASGTGNIEINSNVTFRDPILLQSPGGQLDITASISLTDNATLDFNVQTLVKSGSSILTVNGNTATTFIGNTAINGGVLLLAKSPNTEALNNAPISVNSGTLQISSNEQINNAADLTLNGGSFSLNGFNETLDRLQVTNDSTINLGNGSSKLAFGNSSTTNWTGILSIENWSSTSGESIRFGNSANGLTPAQLNNIQFVGFGRGANINASGFLTPVGITVVNPTPDQDGVNDDIEDLAANNGDGNFDGIRDSFQENVASILNLGGVNVNNIATIVAQAGARISGLRSLATPITAANLTSLANPIEFKIAGLANGASTAIEYLIARADQNRQYNSYVMFGPTADNPTPHAYEFLYNGQTGAKLFDTNGDGLTDKAIVHFVDGLRGDGDLTVNGEIQDPSAPGFTNTPVGLSNDANNVVQITGTAGAAIANFSLVANQTRQVSEVGFFRIDGANTVRGIATNAAGFARAALQSGQVIFSSLADNLLSATDISRQLQLSAGDRLGFYLVQNGTVDAALQRNDFSNVVFSLNQANPAGRRALEVATESNGSYRLKWEQGNTEVNDDLILNLQLQNAPLNNQNLVASIQGDRESELLDLSSFTGRDVQVTFTIRREAAFNNTVGFYQVEDAQGTITSITGAKIKPGEVGYQAAVVQNRIAGVDLAVANGQTASIDAVLRGGAIYAPFLIANANPGSLNGNFSNVYTSYTVGNADTTDHVRLLGDNTFGFEDLVGAGDRDFNDVVLKAVFRNS